MADGLVSIGTFSLLTGLSITTLRHYDDVGLLVPADVDPRTGFRKYRLNQVDRANRVRMLRSVELSPEDIAAVLDSDDSTSRLVMKRHRDALDERSAQIGRLTRQLDTYIEKGLDLISDKRIAREMAGTLESTSFAGLGDRHIGKVRDSYVQDGVRTIVTTDRVSAFDRLLGTIPFKGQALNAVANYWFEATSDIIPNHLLDVPATRGVRSYRVRPAALATGTRIPTTSSSARAKSSAHSTRSRSASGWSNEDFAATARRRRSRTKCVLQPQCATSPSPKNSPSSHSPSPMRPRRNV